MIKNFIIAGLCIYIYAQVPGWYVEGVAKLLVCMLLAFTLGVLITNIEVMIKRDLRRKRK